jgi:hypothetical protein
MSLNKKQKKQLDIEQKRLSQLRQQLSGAKKQMDDPAEIVRLERDIADCEARISKARQDESH